MVFKKFEDGSEFTEKHVAVVIGVGLAVITIEVIAYFFSGKIINKLKKKFAPK